LYYKTDTLTTPTTFLKKCEKSNKGVILRDGGSIRDGFDVLL